jgi:hypothetical protein
MRLFPVKCHTKEEALEALQRFIKAGNIPYTHIYKGVDTPQFTAFMVLTGSKARDIYVIKSK